MLLFSDKMPMQLLTTISSWTPTMLFYAGSIENSLYFVIYLTLLYVLTAFGFYLWLKNIHKNSVTAEFRKNEGKLKDKNEL